MFKKIIIVIGSILFLIVLVDMTKQIVIVWQANYRLDKATDDVATLQRQNNDLKKELQQAESLSFIEQEARDKLNMERAGETVVIIGQPQDEKKIAVNIPVIIPDNTSNLQAWLNLFLR